MSTEDTISLTLDQLRESNAVEALLDDTEWPADAWRHALAQDAAIPSVRTLVLPGLPWTAALLARLPKLFPSVESLTIAWKSDGVSARPTLADALVPWWDAGLTKFDCAFAREWGATEPPARPARFTDTLEALVLRDLRRDALAEVLRAVGALARLSELTVGVIDEPSVALTRLPSLRSFTCAFDPKAKLEATFDSPSLRSLSVTLRRRAVPVCLRLSGTLPSLEALSLQQVHDDRTSFDTPSLVALIAGAANTLTSVTLSTGDPWPLALTIAECLAARRDASLPTLPTLTVARRYANDGGGTAAERAEDFARMCAIRGLGFKLDPVSWLTVVDRPAHLLATLEEMATLETVSLRGEIHSFLLEQPALFAHFTAARSVDVFHARALTSDGLDALLRALPALAHLTLINGSNPAMDRLTLRSQSLESARFTHFHQLKTWAFDAPALRRLELDNCETNPAEGATAPFNTDAFWLYGDFSERVCKSVFDGEPQSHLPALRELYLWNNPFGYGQLAALEALRVDVTCAVGHRTLETLAIQNLAHLRSLTLKNVPNLRRLGVSTTDDDGPGTTWLAQADLAGLPEGCEIELCSLSPGRVGLTLP
jgi:hypothetical protein